MARSTKMIEDFESSLFAGISAEELAARKIALARVLDQVKKALANAESAGKTALADQLQDKADRLQELFDRAEEFLDEIEDKTSEDEYSDEAPDDANDAEDISKKDSEEKTADDLAGEESDENTDIEGTGKAEDKDTPADESEDTDELDEPAEPSEANDDTTTTDEEDKPEKPGSKSSTTSKASSSSGTDDSGDESGDEDSDEEEEEDEELDDATSSEKSTDTDDKDDESEDKTLIDPFSRPPLGAKPVPPAKNKEVESVFDAAKRILSKLDGEARRGAVQGVKDLLNKKGDYVESLTTPLKEAITKSIAQMSDEEFNNELSSAMELVDKVLDIDYSDDLDKRVAEIKRDAVSSLARLELEKEDAEYIKTDKTAMKAFDRENDKYKNVKALKGLEAFQATLYRAVSDQVEQAEDEVDSWAALDRRHEDDPSIIKKGRILDDGDESIPSINVYFDQSGSWRDSDIEIGKRAISVINEFHERGEIKLNIFYMSAGGVFTTAAAARADGRAEGWHAALQHIKSSRTKNVIILSDQDLDSYEPWNRPTGDNGRTIVDGCVWWLWKDSSVSNKALKELVGRRGNFQYQFKGAGYY